MHSANLRRRQEKRYVRWLERRNAERVAATLGPTPSAPSPVVAWMRRVALESTAAGTAEWYAKMEKLSKLGR